MARQVLVGIDVGTTALKAAAFEAASGRVLGQVVKTLKVRVEPDGTREQDTASIDRALRASLASLARQVGRTWSKVAGVGLAAQGGSAIIADRQSGKALTPLILWNDTRSLAHLGEIAASKPRSYWRRLSWREVPGAGLGKMRWLQQRRAELFGDDTIYVGIGEYVYHALTEVWRQDACNAAQIGCYDVPNRRLVRGPLDIVGVPLSFVAPLRQGHTTEPLRAKAAKRFGLPEGVPVAGPYMDHEAGYMSATELSARPMQCSLGTAWVSNFVLGERVKWSSPFQLVMPSPIGRGWLVIQPLLTGNVSWNWGLQTLLGPTRQRALRRLDAVFGQALLPPEHLTCLPWLPRPNPLNEGGFGGGMMLGISPHTSRQDLLRALAAGLCYEFYRVVRQVHERRAVDSVVLAGGASKGWFFGQIFAALFAPLHVHTLENEYLSGSRGAIYPFSRRAGSGRARRVRLPIRSLRTRIERGFEAYMTAYDRLYSRFAPGGPLTFK